MKTFTQHYFISLLLLLFFTTNNLTAQVQAEIEGKTRITADAPRLELYDGAVGEERIEGWLEEGGDRIYLSSFYDDLVFSASTTGTEVERMWLDAPTGYLGIGTSSPNANLEILDGTLNGSRLQLTATQGNAITTYNVDGSLYHMGMQFNGAFPRPFIIGAGSGPSASGTLFELSSEGRLSLTPNNANESMTLFNDGTYNHANGIQEFGDTQAPFILASEESYVETGGIYGSGEAFAIWSTGDGAPGELDAYLYILDEDLFDGSDTNPYNNGALKAYVTTAGVWQPSDYNKKENISRVENGLNKISTLQAYRYDYKRNQIEIDKNSTVETAVGIMAQELIKVVPEAVQVTSEGEHFVNYSMITPVLIEAINEQQSIIEDLRNRIEALERK